MIEAPNGVVQRKLALLDDQVTKLEFHLRDVSRELFVNDWVLRSMAERALQVAAELMIDIAERIIALKGAGPVASAGDAIRKLTELKVLLADDSYLDIIRFRNLLVHQYEEINPDMLFDLAKNRLGNFRKFRDEVDKAGY
jgi:uncharacterized protein YutE (UPF0331/DUF86 family)